MPKDVDIAESLATDLNLQTFSKEFTSAFHYDPFVKSENVDDIQIRVSVEGIYRELEARSRWHRAANISVFVLAPQQSNATVAVDAKTEISALLEFWDEVVDYIEGASPNGNRAVSIEPYAGTRFDKETLHDNRQFRAGVMVSYKLI